MSGTGVPRNIQPAKVIVEPTCAAHFIISKGPALYTKPAFETLTGYSTEKYSEPHK